LQVIGVRGGEIKHIKANFSVDVHMPNADSLSENVIVVGAPANCERAVKYIVSLMTKADQIGEKRLEEY
jgi:hypothetical protein